MDTLNKRLADALLLSFAKNMELALEYVNHELFADETYIYTIAMEEILSIMDLASLPDEVWERLANMRSHVEDRLALRKVSKTGTLDIQAAALVRLTVNFKTVMKLLELGKKSDLTFRAAHKQYMEDVVILSNASAASQVHQVIIHQQHELAAKCNDRYLRKSAHQLIDWLSSPIDV